MVPHCLLEAHRWNRNTYLLESPVSGWWHLSLMGIGRATTLERLLTVRWQPGFGSEWPLVTEGTGRPEELSCWLLYVFFWVLSGMAWHTYTVWQEINLWWVEWGEGWSPHLLDRESEGLKKYRFPRQKTDPLRTVKKTSETSPESKQRVHLSMQDNDRCLLAQTMLVAWYFKQESTVRCFFSGTEK